MEGLISEGDYKRNGKSASKQAKAVLIQNAFSIYWRLMQLQKIIINRIRFNTS